MFNDAGLAKTCAAAAGVVTLLAPVQPAQAQTEVTFEGTVVASCTLSVTTPGVLGVSTDSATEIGTEQPGGTAAVLSVSATAGTPTISFTAPSMSVKPADYTGTPTVSIRYSSPGGANQGYTSGASQYTSSNATGDTVTLHAKAVDTGGFADGAYRIQSIATCEQ